MPDNNKENLALTNVKGDRTTKFALLNWTAYLNTKPMFTQSSMQLFTILSLSLTPIPILTLTRWNVYDTSQMMLPFPNV